MPRLIAVVGGGIWMLLLLAVVLPQINGQPDAGDGNCPRLCSCLGDVIDCSEKALDALFHIPGWVGNLI
ncbi:hypothetical protein quinque_009421 [Culex quinquefasciatus]